MFEFVPKFPFSNQFTPLTQYCLAPQHLRRLVCRRIRCWGSIRCGKRAVKVTSHRDSVTQHLKNILHITSVNLSGTVPKQNILGMLLPSG